MEEILAVVGMFLLRLGVPLLLTIAVGYGLRRLDARWEAEAQLEHAAPIEAEMVTELQALKPARPCWEQKGCTEAQRAHCPACKSWDVPCWVAHLRATGRLPAACHDCELFTVSATA